MNLNSNKGLVLDQAKCILTSSVGAQAEALASKSAARSLVHNINQQPPFHAHTTYRRKIQNFQEHVRLVDVGELCTQTALA